MATLRMQKIVYEGLDDLQEITADTMSKWFRAYGKVAGSIDITKMASPVAERLASLGVMTVGDLRHVTADVYEERCDLTCIAAIRLHKHFGMVPEVLAREDVKDDVEVPQTGLPPSGVTDLDEGVDPGANDDRAPEVHGTAAEHIAGAAEDICPTETEALREGLMAVGQDTVEVASTSHSSGVIPGWESVGGSMTTHSGAATTDTKGTDSTATDKSEVQSIVATMSQSVSMLAQSMLQAQEIQAQQTRLLLGATQGLAKIPKLEQKTCARPTVKATMAWVRAVADVQYAVPGLTAALEALMRHPHAIDREDFVDAVDEADDVRIFTKVKGSMLDVYKNMVAVTGQAERVSAMGLIYDTLHYALKKPDAWLVMKLDWLMNKVKPMNKGEDLKTLFEEWHGVVVEVEHSGSAGSAAVYDSLEVLMSRFGPQYNRAVRDSKYKDTQPSDMERLIVAMSQQVEVLAEQFPVEKLKPRDTRKKKEWTKDRKPTGAAEYRAPKGEAKEYKKPSKESMQCYEFALTGKCTKGADCRFRHDKDLSRKVMLALQEKMATAQMAQEAEGDEGERWVGYCGVEADPDPDPDSECEINPTVNYVYLESRI